MLTASSGALVPNATIVRPTISGAMPSARAIREAPRTRLCAPITSSASPPMTSERFVSIASLLTAARPQREWVAARRPRVLPSQAEHLNPTLVRGAGPDGRLHAGRDGHELAAARPVRDDAAADRLAQVLLPEHVALVR